MYIEDRVVKACRMCWDRRAAELETVGGYGTDIGARQHGAQGILLPLYPVQVMTESHFSVVSSVSFYCSEE